MDIWPILILLCGGVTIIVFIVMAFMDKQPSVAQELRRHRDEIDATPPKPTRCPRCQSSRYKNFCSQCGHPNPVIVSVKIKGTKIGGGKYEGKSFDEELREAERIAAKIPGFDPMPMDIGPPLPNESAEDYLKRVDGVELGGNIYGRNFIEWVKRRKNLVA